MDTFFLPLKSSNLTSSISVSGPATVHVGQNAVYTAYAYGNIVGDVQFYVSGAPNSGNYPNGSYREVSRTHNSIRFEFLGADVMTVHGVIQTTDVGFISSSQTITILP
ncbi:hypothetical protein FNH22_29875 [Fulvivirga sp. M361]|uniref:hypothetical protein n=1 Tax=Fulvivirga sp. M361 TaxID=2594266 RepID=UPI001179C793|nr:hypothetical protein [Fulvivirga sp. M361]TRX48075.1 hypothetical protein FNH22_29875 [Fulvivirga sp. M361]